MPPELRTTLTYVRLVLAKPFKFNSLWGKATRYYPHISSAGRLVTPGEYCGDVQTYQSFACLEDFTCHRRKKRTAPRGPAHWGKELIKKDMMWLLQRGAIFQVYA